MPPVKKPHSGNHGNASNKSVGVIQTGKKTEKQIKQEMNELIQKQNADMLKLLEDEQTAQNEREERFKRANHEEKKRLEKEFGVERAKAQTRIQKLSE